MEPSAENPQEPVIRLDLAHVLQSVAPVILELGCGAREAPGRIAVDRVDLPHVDIVADLEGGLPFLPDNSVDEVYARSLLEHIEGFDLLMSEIWRVLKSTGKSVVFVPHFSNPYYYSDHTHRRFFGLYSFEYFSSRPNRFRRRVPSFYHDFGFVTEEITLVFKSPWKTRKVVKRIFQAIFNLSPRLQEFYEENLCYMMPCYAVQATLMPVKQET